MLSWHVDYWDYLGWKDPFGSKAFTRRQRRYQRALKLKQIWTPGFFVDNKVARGNQVLPAVKKAAARKARVAIDAKATLEDGKILVTTKLTKLDPKLEPGKSTFVFAALWRRQATTECKAGENAGKTLREFFIVLDTDKPVALADVIDKGTRHGFKLPAGLKAKDVGVAILVEDAATMHTLNCRNVAVTTAG